MEEVEYRELVYRHYTMEEFLIYISNSLNLHTYTKYHISEMVQEFLNNIDNRPTVSLDFLLFSYIAKYASVITYIKTVDICGNE